MQYAMLCNQNCNKRTYLHSKKNHKTWFLWFESAIGVIFNSLLEFDHSNFRNIKTNTILMRFTTTDDL